MPAMFAVVSDFGHSETTFDELLPDGLFTEQVETPLQFYQSGFKIVVTWDSQRNHVITEPPSRIKAVYKLLGGTSVADCTFVPTRRTETIATVDREAVDVATVLASGRNERVIDLWKD